MKARHRRAIYIGVLLLGVGLAAALALTAFQQNLLYFYSPSQIRAGEAPAEARFRIGGLVEQGSVQRAGESLEVRFVLADCQHSVPVRYTGILPDLFREGQGIVAYGRLSPDGAFVADEVLAKHDENYMPREVADSLQQEGGESCMPTGMGKS